MGLQFRHTDNINHWRNAMMTLGLPLVSEQKNWSGHWSHDQFEFRVIICCCRRRCFLDFPSRNYRRVRQEEYAPSCLLHPCTQVWSPVSLSTYLFTCRFNLGLGQGDMNQKIRSWGGVQTQILLHSKGVCTFYLYTCLPIPLPVSLQPLSLQTGFSSTDPRPLWESKVYR